MAVGHGKSTQGGQYFSEHNDKKENYQQSRRRKSQGDRNQDELNKSRRSSRSHVREEDLPENYAELAKRVYQMAEKEGWSQKKVFDLLKDPVKLVKTMENVRYLLNFAEK